MKLLSFTGDNHDHLRETELTYGVYSGNND